MINQLRCHTYLICETKPQPASDWNNRRYCRIISRRLILGLRFVQLSLSGVRGGVIVYNPEPCCKIGYYKSLLRRAIIAAPTVAVYKVNNSTARNFNYIGLERHISRMARVAFLCAQAGVAYAAADAKLGDNLYSAPILTCGPKLLQPHPSQISLLMAAIPAPACSTNPLSGTLLGRFLFRKRSWAEAVSGSCKAKKASMKNV